MAQMKTFLQEFGMTPSARVRLKTGDGEKRDDGDELTAFQKAHPRRRA
jgi:phage terminase small subunit